MREGVESFVNDDVTNDSPPSTEKARSRTRSRRVAVKKPKQYLDGVISLRKSLRVRKLFVKESKQYPNGNMSSKPVTIQGKQEDRVSARRRVSPERAQKSSTPPVPPLEKTQQSKRSFKSPIETITASDLELTRKSKLIALHRC